jgi:hypothetical protein
MRIIELTSNLNIALTNEEADFLLNFNKKDISKFKTDLSERQILIANQLVNKNVLQRTKDQGRIVYKRTDR